MKLKSFIVKVRKDLPRGDPDAYEMFWCRGEGKCRRSRFKQEHSKLPCEDCHVEKDRNKTIGELAEALKRGDG